MLKFLYITFFIFLSALLKGQDSLVFDNNFDACIDSYNNVCGGIKKGSVIRSLFAYTPVLIYNSFELKSSVMFASGKSPSATLTGDFQTLSNIDADISLFLYEFYLSISKKKYHFQGGILNMNESFVSCDKSSYLINSSFGIPSQISSNSPLSIFPRTTLGLSFERLLVTKGFIKIGIYDGFPHKIKNNELLFGIHLRDGLFFISEYEHTYQKMNLKFGCFNHTGSLKKTDSINLVPKHNGFYYLQTYDFINKTDVGFSVFLQLSYSFNRYVQHFYYLGGGINFFFDNDQKNSHLLSLGCAYAGNRNEKYNETALELTFLSKINKWFYLQPDIQFIINPSGTDKKLENALMLNLRLMLKL